MTAKIRNFRAEAEYFVKKSKWVRIGVMLARYALLVVFGFVFIYPITYAALTSFMPTDDVLNPLVNIVPSSFTTANYNVMLDKFNVFKAMGYSAFLSGVSGALSSLACGVTGYAFSRFNFKLKGLYMALTLACFIIPGQVLMIPTYLGFSNLKIIGSPLAFFLPAVLGQGFKAPIFILIFYSFFNTIPKDLDEAGSIDGAGPFTVFTRVLLPLAMPAVVLTFIFSLVWYWNETYLTSLYIGDSARTLLNDIAAVLSTLENEAARDPMTAKINAPVKMAAVCLIIAPLVAFYLVMQRQFVESIDKSGITGE